jgi:hypothetical protein
MQDLKQQSKKEIKDKSPFMTKKENESPLELFKYKSDVEYMAKNKIDFEFGNSSEVHAAIVMSTMLKYAEKDVKLYVRNLDGCILDRAESDFKEYLDYFVNKRNGKISIVVEEKREENSEIYAKIKQISNSKSVEVRHAPPTSEFKKHILKLFKDNPSEVFFMVSDNRAYRLEIDNEKHQAFCNFNESKYASKLVHAFESNFKSCTDFF